mgnify:CR=1 FL=1
MNNPVLENLKTRRSIRKYLPRQVEPEKLALVWTNDAAEMKSYTFADMRDYHRCAGSPIGSKAGKAQRQGDEQQFQSLL